MGSRPLASVITIFRFLVIFMMFHVAKYLENSHGVLTQVVSDCPTPEAGEYAAHALGSLSCDNFENASLMIAVDFKFSFRAKSY